MPLVADTKDANTYKTSGCQAQKKSFKRKSVTFSLWATRASFFCYRISGFVSNAATELILHQTLIVVQSPYSLLCFQGSSNWAVWEWAKVTLVGRRASYCGGSPPHCMVIAARKWIYLPRPRNSFVPSCRPIQKTDLWHCQCSVRFRFGGGAETNNNESYS